MAAHAKKAQQFARQLFKMSVVNGTVSPERVSGVLQYVEKHKVANPLIVLKAYARLIATELAKSHATVEHAGEISAATLSTIAAAMSKKYGRPVTASAKPNPALLAGLRVQVSDDVYESSVAGQLAALSAAV
ncbi:MAG TPA: F0F1 ATP synthase subunit delta [Opitutaceae bacterium]|nr:F0F1 ATP synthase subunit delta [Opitutaceae bacterium]